MFETMARWGIDELITPRKKARTYYDDTRKDLGLPWATDPPLTEPGKVKEAALYVDIGEDGRLLTPDRAADRAAVQILGLEYFLDEYHALPRVLEDDERWAHFAARLRPAPDSKET